MQTMMRFCNDIEEVKLCAFKCLPSFLEEVSVEGRENMIEFLGDLFRSNDNWRVREARCEMIGAMAKYFVPDKLFQKMIHVLWEKTLEDEVRNGIFKLNIAELCCSQGSCRELLIVSIEGVTSREQDLKSRHSRIRGSLQGESKLQGPDSVSFTM